MSKFSDACCTIPPIVSKGYEPKGKYITVDGMKTYHTGPSNATRAILVFYDVMGFFPQTLQGADILAYSDREHPYQVFMPDFFEGTYAEVSWFPANTDEKMSKLKNFMSTAADPAKTVPRVPKVVKEIEEKVKKFDENGWGVMGYCWGGKIVNLVSRKDTPFRAAACAHPAMVDPEDAPQITIPIAMLPSKDENAKDVEAWKGKLSVKSKVESFPTQTHGWMAARADLEDEKVKEEYERGYKVVLDFFHDHL